MKNFKKFLKNTSISMIALALVPWSSAGAVPTILVQPYENISKIGTTNLTVTGADLEPNTTINVFQRSFAPYSAAEGDDPTRTGTKVEQRFRARLIVDTNGNISGVVPVTYDITAGGTIDYCDTIQSVQRLCVLSFMYFDGPLSGQSALEQKLYFGMAGPVITPPAVTTPVTKDDCKDEKWSDFSSFGFKNQGACVSYVASKS